MLLRLLKYLFIAAGAIVSLIVALVAVQYFFPPTYEATADLPGTTSHIIVQLEPMHPYLAEYRRALVLRKAGAPDQRLEMFPDTGGYSRTQLYRLPDGRFVVRGFFDTVSIDPAKHGLFAESETARDMGTYLGAFDDTGNGQWRFIDAARSPEQPLKAEGG